MDNGKFDDFNNSGPDDGGFTQSDTRQNVNQNMNQNMNQNANQNDSQSTEQASGYAIAGFVFGLFAILCCCVPWLSFVCAILGLVFSIIAKVKKLPGGGLAIAGIVCSAVGIALSLTAIVAGLVIGFGVEEFYRNQNISDWYALFDHFDHLD